MKEVRALDSGGPDQAKVAGFLSTVMNLLGLVKGLISFTAT